MEKKVFPEAEAEILCSGRVREENFPNPAAGVAILRRSCYCKGTKKAVQTIRNDENTVRHRQHDLQKRRKAKQHDAKTNRKTAWHF